MEEYDEETPNLQVSAKTPVLLLEGRVRSSLENIIQAGFCSFPVAYSSGTEEIIDTKLEISKEVISLKPSHSDLPVFSGTFSIGNPEVTLHLADCKRLIFLFPDKTRFVVQCLSRTSRDLIVMALHIFAAHTCILHSKALEQFSTSFDRLELSLELNEVLSQLHYLSNQNSLLAVENKRVKKELSDMEKDLENTIESYQCTLGSGNDENSEDLDKVKNDLAKNIDKKNKLRKRLRRKEKEINELTQKLEEFRESQQNLLLDLKNSSALETEEKIQDFKEKLAQAHIELHEKNQMCMEGLSKISELSELVSILQEKILIVEKENLKLNKEIFDHSSLVQEFSQLKNQNEALLGQRNILSKRIEALQEELESVCMKKELVEEGLGKKLTGVEEENRSLKEIIEKMREEKKSDDVEVLKEETLKYRQQCDNLAAQLSRMQAQMRRNK